MFSTRRAVAVLCALCVSAVTYPAWAQTSRESLNLQGRLTDNTGACLTGSYSFQIDLYDAPGGGTLLYSDTQGAVTVTDGIYNIEIGAGSGGPINQSVFSGCPDVWIEIIVGGETLSPRTHLTSVAYAFCANLLDGMDSTAFAPASGSVNYLGTTGGTLSGSLNADGGVSTTAGNLTLTSSTSTVVVSGGASVTGSLGVLGAANFTSLITANAGIDLTGQPLVNLGAPVAGTDAATKGYVDGVVGGPKVSLAPAAADADASADSSIFINDTGGGNLLRLQSGAADKFVVGPVGEVDTFGFATVRGIGAPPPVPGATDARLYVDSGTGQLMLSEGGLAFQRVASGTNLLHLGVVTPDLESTPNDTIFVDGGGGGNLLRLQSAAADKFIVGPGGEVDTFGFATVRGIGGPPPVPPATDARLYVDS
ncbi:MAG: hypothetical protein HYY93_01000, partial [Planctomycetes bacterium]|nr:hypothetical protein [Planctomycetota bacterium]